MKNDTAAPDKYHCSGSLYTTVHHGHTTASTMRRWIHFAVLELIGDGKSIVFNTGRKRKEPSHESLRTKCELFKSNSYFMLRDDKI